MTYDHLSTNYLNMPRPHNTRPNWDDFATIWQRPTHHQRALAGDVVTLLRAAGDPQHIDDLCHGQGCRWRVSRERWQWWS
jgi:hypothetical protein